jgi:hypothetical protein
VAKSGLECTAPGGHSALSPADWVRFMIFTFLFIVMHRLVVYFLCHLFEAFFDSDADCHFEKILALSSKVEEVQSTARQTKQNSQSSLVDSQLYFLMY